MKRSKAGKVAPKVLAPGLSSHPKRKNMSSSSSHPLAWRLSTLEQVLIARIWFSGNETFEKFLPPTPPPFLGRKMFPAEGEEYTNCTAINYHFLVCSRRPIPSACSSRQNCCYCYCQPVHSSDCILPPTSSSSSSSHHITSYQQQQQQSQRRQHGYAPLSISQTNKHNQSPFTDPQTRYAQEGQKRRSLPVHLISTSMASSTTIFARILCASYTANWTSMKKYRRPSNRFHAWILCGCVPRFGRIYIPMTSGSVWYDNNNNKRKYGKRTIFYPSTPRPGKSERESKTIYLLIDKTNFKAS